MAYDISLGHSDHFGMNKDQMAWERRADLHSGNRIVTYLENEQKWILSPLSPLIPLSHLTCNPLEHHKEDN